MILLYFQRWTPRTSTYHFPTVFLGLWGAKPARTRTSETVAVATRVVRHKFVVGRARKGEGDAVATRVVRDKFVVGRGGNGEADAVATRVVRDKFVVGRGGGQVEAVMKAHDVAVLYRDRCPP